MNGDFFPPAPERQAETVENTMYFERCRRRSGIVP
jgi:hypothetical protein